MEKHDNCAPSMVLTLQIMFTIQARSRQPRNHRKALHLGRTPRLPCRSREGAKSYEATTHSNTYTNDCKLHNTQWEPSLEPMSENCRDLYSWFDQTKANVVFGTRQATVGVRNTARKSWLRHMLGAELQLYRLAARMTRI